MRNGRESLLDAFDPEKPMAFKKRPYKRVPECLYQTAVAQDWLDLHRLVYTCDEKGWFGVAGVIGFVPIAGDLAVTPAVAFLVYSKFHKLLANYERRLQNDPDTSKLKRWKKHLLREHKGLAGSMLVRGVGRSLLGQPPIIGDALVGLLSTFKIATLLGQHTVSIWAKWEETEYGTGDLGDGPRERMAQTIFEEADRLRPLPKARTKNTQPTTNSKKSNAGRATARQPAGKVGRTNAKGAVRKPPRAARR